VNVIDISQEKFHVLIGIISSKLKTDIQYNDKKIKEKKTNNDPEIIHISFYLRLRWYHTLQVMGVIYKTNKRLSMLDFCEGFCRSLFVLLSFFF
jgi:hypothetical protein